MLQLVVNVSGGTTTCRVVSMLEPASVYNVTVNACNTQGCSDPSSTVQGTTGTGG